MRRLRHKVTQQHIARKVGISQAAVSAILSGSTSLAVGEETRAMVLMAAKELGYAMRKSSQKRKASIRSNVLLVESRRSKVAENEDWLERAYESFRCRLLSASSEFLQARGMGLSVFHLGEAGELLQWLSDSEVSGVIWHAGDQDSSLLHWVASRLPLVLLNREGTAPAPFDTVRVDQEQNILLSAEYLWELGHRRIATFGHHAGNSIYRRRMKAYHLFVKERGLRDYGEFQDISDDVNVSALEKVGSILAAWQKLGAEAPTALITNDAFALLVLREARALGIGVPEELSIVGIDNTPPCALMEPALSSMEQPLREMCQIAVDLLLRRKANPSAPGTTVQISPRLIVRKSSIHRDCDSWRIAK